jgi:hypothetical protein
MMIVCREKKKKKQWEKILMIKLNKTLKKTETMMEWRGGGFAKKRFS